MSWGVSTFMQQVAQIVVDRFRLCNPLHKRIRHLVLWPRYGKMRSFRSHVPPTHSHRACRTPGFRLRTRRPFRSLDRLFQATHQQIYRELGRLEETGWIESLPAESGAAASARTGSCRPAEGVAALDRRTGRPTPLRGVDGAPARGAVLGPAGLEDEIRRRIALHQEKLDLYLQIEARDFSESADSRTKRLQHPFLQAGIANERFWSNSRSTRSTCCACRKTERLND